MSPDGGRSLRFAILYFVLLVSFSSRLYYARPASGVNSVTDSVHSFCPSDCRELCTSPSACRHGSADNDLAVAPKDGRQGAPNDSPSSACGGGSQAVRPNVDSSLPDAGNFEFSIGYSVMRNICCNRTDQEGPLTHLNFAFVSFRQDYKLTTKNRDFLSRSGLIKARHRHIKTVISIKGWASEGSLPSASWSYITRNWHSRQTFIKSVVEIVNEYDLDGVDFDCVNTPVISGERESSDADNFVSLLADLHELSNARNSTRTISITILASSTQLKQFRIRSIERYLSWFTLIPLHLHWPDRKHGDEHSRLIRCNKSLEQIKPVLQVLSLNNVPLKKVVLGLLFGNQCSTPRGAHGQQSDCIHSLQDNANTRSHAKILAEGCLNGLFIWPTNENAHIQSSLEGLLNDVAGLRHRNHSSSNNQRQVHASLEAQLRETGCSATDPGGDMSREPEAHLAHPAGSASISTARHEFPFHNQGLIKREDELPVKFEKLRDMSKVGPEQSDVLWYYSKQSLSPKMGNNSRGGRSSNAEEKDLSQDAQGFIMLEGPPSSIDNSFATAHTVVRKEARIPNFKRSDVTSNMSTLESVFDPLEQTLYVYCNYRPGSDECKRVWIDGAEDTIIRLPEHVGEGPFARIVSIKPVNEDYKLPDHHLIHRRAERLSDPVYEIKIDYNFQAVQPKKDDHPISIRVDYTNLRGYWEEISVAEARRKRSFKGDTPAKVHDWQARVNKAVARDQEYAKRSDSFHATKVMSGGDGAQLHRRWWAEFIEWLRRIVCSPSPLSA